MFLTEFTSPYRDKICWDHDLVGFFGKNWISQETGRNGPLVNRRTRSIKYNLSRRNGVPWPKIGTGSFKRGNETWSLTKGRKFTEQMRVSQDRLISVQLAYNDENGH